MKTLTLLFALALSLQAEVPCLNGQGPLQEGQQNCNYFASQVDNIDTFAWLTTAPSTLVSFTALYITVTDGVDGDWKTKAFAAADECKQADDCRVIRVFEGDKLMAELDTDGEWHYFAPPKDVAAAILYALRGGR